MKMRALAVDVGAKFAEAEPIEFVFEENDDRVFPGFKRGNYKPAHNLYVSISNENLTNYLKIC